MNFAGRWKGEVFLTPEQLKMSENNQSPDLSENPDYLRFSDDPSLADEVIGRHLGYRLSEIENIKNTISTDFSAIDLMTLAYNASTEPDFRTTGMGLYYIKKLVALYSNEWTSETSIYDLEAWDANLKYFFERVQKNPERQFLIPVDFHS